MRLIPSSRALFGGKKKRTVGLFYVIVSDSQFFLAFLAAGPSSFAPPTSCPFSCLGSTDDDRALLPSTGESSADPVEDDAGVSTGVDEIRRLDPFEEASDVALLEEAVPDDEAKVLF